MSVGLKVVVSDLESFLPRPRTGQTNWWRKNSKSQCDGINTCAPDDAGKYKEMGYKANDADSREAEKNCVGACNLLGAEEAPDKRRQKAHAPETSVHETELALEVEESESMTAEVIETGDQCHQQDLRGRVELFEKDIPR